ncbi:hypothetical protein [Streptomyces sp. NPDC006270]|uniref:hypothetical protein n=1 Tax=Streptomyces sp. NPDC006270 TaxID=3364741 RepID=UPI0036C18132
MSRTARADGVRGGGRGGMGGPAVVRVLRDATARRYPAGVVVSRFGTSAMGPAAGAARRRTAPEGTSGPASAQP